MTTTINYEGAAFLFQIALDILMGIDADKEVRAVLPCNNTNITFEYRPDENYQMTAYLTLNDYRLKPVGSYCD